MAGLAPISMQRWEPGARAQFLRAETLAAIEVWADYGLGTPLPNPVEADANGTFPPIFIDEDLGFYRLRITTAKGVILYDLVTLPVIGPGGEGGGAETPVDPDALTQTGELIFSLRDGIRPGCVRVNGRTIGATLSGATERANSDCEALFSWYWNNHSNDMAPVVGGRGVSAASDWLANKQITLFNAQNKALFGLDGMGATSAGGFANVAFTKGTATTPGAIGGLARRTITKDQVPNYNLVTTGVTTASFQRVTSVTTSNVGVNASGALRVIDEVTAPNVNNGLALTGTLPSGGSGAAIETVSPFILGTIYQKL